MKYLKTAVLAAVMAIAAMAIAVSSAAAQSPAPGYEQFAGCVNDPASPFCLRAEINSGHIQIGGTDTPINKQIVLSGGLVDGKLVYNSKGGLIAPPLNVPGGLTGLTGWSEFFLNLFTFGANQVQAQAILVGDAKVELGADALVTTLPIRIKLINPFLVSTCSIGSAGNPITLKLTTGTTAPPAPNKPITGVFAPFGPDPKLAGVLVAPGNSLVDNAFGAPAATGCDLLGFGLINGVVNTRVGLPAAAGTNTAVFSNSTVKLGFRSVVYP